MSNGNKPCEDCRKWHCVCNYMPGLPTVAPPPASPEPRKRECQDCGLLYEGKECPAHFDSEASPEPMPQGQCGDPLCDFDNCGVDEPHTVEKDWQFLVFDAYGQKLLGDGDLAELRALLATQGLEIVSRAELEKRNA